VIINSYSDRAHLSRATRSERSPLPSRGEPRAADGEAFWEGPAKDFGALGCARGFRNPRWETEAGNRGKCFGGAPPGVGIRPEAEPRQCARKRNMGTINKPVLSAPMVRTLL